MKQTAVEWLYDQLKSTRKKYMGFKNIDIDYQEIIEQAKEMEKEQSHKYAEFAISCDRLEMKILNFEDWIKLQTFKSE